MALAVGDHTVFGNVTQTGAAQRIRGGVAMAEAAAASASDPWVRDLAARMARNQAIDHYRRRKQEEGMPERSGTGPRLAIEGRDETAGEAESEQTAE